MRKQREKESVYSWYLLRKVDLSLASSPILAEINQIIMPSLIMVVVVSLAGTIGRVEEVLKVLKYPSFGQGILAVFFILSCAMIPDRIMLR